MNCTACGNFIGENTIFVIRAMRYCPGCRPAKKAAPAAPDKPPRPKCRACNRNVACRPRDLCWTCYQDLEVRVRFGFKDSPFTYRSSIPIGRLKTPEPTAFFPGSPEKLLVLEHRAEAGEKLWHPLDASNEGPTDRRGAFLESVEGSAHFDNSEENDDAEA